MDTAANYSSQIMAISELLVNHNYQLAVAESCTAGLLGAALTELPGASHWFLGGIIAYNNTIKQNLLRISPDLLSQHGAVSDQIAIAMAQGAAATTGANIAIAITGFASAPKHPANTSKHDDNPDLGTVCLALTHGDYSQSSQHKFTGSRAAIRQQAVSQSLELLANYLNYLPRKT